MRKAPYSRRSGNTVLYFLIFMGMTVPTMFLALDNQRLVAGKVQQQRFCDAAVHAATCELTRPPILYTATTDSPLLFGDPTAIQTLCQTDCINEAIKYAGMNYVDGAALSLVTTPAQTDVKFGSYSFATKGPFTAIDPTTATTLERRAINAVRVEAFRTIARKNSVPLFGPAWTGYTDAQIVTRTTAALDRNVVGFWIQPNFATPSGKMGYQKIPLAPIAILSDPTAANTKTWEFQVESTAAPGSALPATIAYGNMEAALDDANDVTNIAFLGIGTATIPQLIAQLQTGVTQADLTAFGSNLILAKATNTIDVPEIAAPLAASADFASLTAALQAMVGTGREFIFPLYQNKKAGPAIEVSAFVAARITAADIYCYNTITKVKGAKGGCVMPGLGDENALFVTLRPTLLETPTAYTDTSYTYSRLVNPYIARVRLVD